MKKLLLPVLLCTSTLLFAQKKTGDLIKNHLYLKVSPALLLIGAHENVIIDDNSPVLRPAIFGAVGAKTRYAALGFSAGYFNMKQAKPVIPLGVDLTLTDFNRKKAFPALTLQWHEAHFSEKYYGGRQDYDIAGKDMYSIGAGVAFRALKTRRMLATLGLSKLRNRTTGLYHSPMGNSTFQFENHQYIFSIAASLVL